MFNTDEEINALKEKIMFKKKNVYEELTDEQESEMNCFSEDYKHFLDLSKTEREAVNQAVDIARKFGFTEYKFGDNLSVGGKYYFNNRGKAIYLFVIGSENVENGVRISAAHIDSPKLDLKQHPLFEEGNMGFLKTHYYGGIKKYQWTAIPLAIHGRVVKSDGEFSDIVIGEDDSDPVFYINDLLPHLAKDQMSKSLAEGIQGEKLNILIGSRPISASGDIKLGLMKILYEKYGIREYDFVSAELSIVPAFKSRDIGFDRSLIGGYGHDDRVCAYPALRAIIETENPVHTLMVVLADKEEVGSGGATGMQSAAFTEILEEIAKSQNANYHTVISNSKCLSADVNAAYDPNFSEVYEAKNSSFINEGVVMTKYTGARGKSGTSDASAEFVGFVRNIFDENNIIWQTGEIGKVDQGGGGTVAIYIANQNIDVVDLGVPVISMHSPYEVIAKADLYMTYNAFLAFNK
jgi:aspartyl aminopeptidase